MLTLFVFAVSLIFVEQSVNRVYAASASRRLPALVWAIFLSLLFFWLALFSGLALLRSTSFGSGAATLPWSSAAH